MKMRVSFAIFLVILSLVLLSWFHFYPLNETLEVYALNKFDNYPIENEIKTHYADDMTLSIFDSADGLIAASIEDQPDIIIMDMMQYLYYYDDFSQYRMAYLRPKTVHFVIDSDDLNITTINQVDKANVAVENYTSHEYLLDSILSKSGIEGLSMQEVLLGNPRLRLKSFLNGHLQFTFFESPYYEESMGRTLQSFNNQYDVILAKEGDDLSLLDSFVKTSNGATENFNTSPPPLSHYQGQLWIPKSFKPYDDFAFSKMKKANRHLIDQGLTWLYANQRILRKYSDDELFFP